MTTIFKKVEAPEKDELLHIVENNPGLFGEGLQLIGKKLGPRNEPPWELLGVRKDKKLVLIALETGITDRTILKLFRNIDWAWENLETLASIYAPYGIDSVQMPCVMVLAPSYTPFFKKSLHYVTYRIEIHLFSYSCLESEKGRGLFVEPVEKKVVKYEQSVNRDKGKKPPREGFSGNLKVTTEEIMEFLQ